MTTELFGVHCTVRFEDSSDLESVYISFEKLEDGSDTLPSGISDEEVFFYCDGLDDLLTRTATPTDGWYLLEITAMATDGA